MFSLTVESRSKLMCSYVWESHETRVGIMKGGEEILRDVGDRESDKTHMLKGKND